MRRLIINADDLGANRPRDAGIFEAIEAAVVTSASILANGPTTGETLERISKGDYGKISFGIHVNLSEGLPLSRRNSPLTGSDGSFLGKHAAMALFMNTGREDLEGAIREEIELQIDFLEARGIGLTHLDGHHHVHLFPAVVGIMTDCAERHGIHWIRVPREVPPACAPPLPPEMREEGRRFSRIAGNAAPLIAGRGFRTTDHFRGLYLKGQLNRFLLRTLLADLEQGVTELMVHPGRALKMETHDHFSLFSTPEREKELEALLNPQFKQDLEETGVKLTSFAPVAER